MILFCAMQRWEFRKTLDFFFFDLTSEQKPLTFCGHLFTLTMLNEITFSIPFAIVSMRCAFCLSLCDYLDKMPVHLLLLFVLQLFQSQKVAT